MQDIQKKVKERLQQQEEQQQQQGWKPDEEYTDLADKVRSRWCRMRGSA